MITKKNYYKSSRLRPLKHIEELLNEEQIKIDKIDKKLSKTLEDVKTINGQDKEENATKVQNLKKRRKKVESLLEKLRHERRLIFLEMLWNSKINFIKFSKLVKNGKKNVMKGKLIEEIRKKINNKKPSLSSEDKHGEKN